MTDQIKYLVFKGTSKKEEILFKSFLNLAKNDLSYQLIVLKDEQLKSHKADIVILDDSYHLTDDDLTNLPTIIVGDDLQNHQPHYIKRPVQWSDFKNAFTGLDVEMPKAVEKVSRVLPSKMNFEIAEMGTDATNLDKKNKDGEDADTTFSDEGDYEYELDKMSIGYHSFTNSDYIKVVDDVKQFQEGGLAESHDPVILVTDDESSSANSVLVIETNSLDAWDFSHSEFDTTQIQTQVTQKTEETTTAETGTVREQRGGFEIRSGEEFWLEDNEIIADNQTFLFIKPARKMVYSDREPGKWPILLQKGALSKVALADNWRPTKDVQVYPLSRLLWANTLVSKTNDLTSGLSEDKQYLLEKWPHFDLLELDNVLLKLCTMLFIRPESVVSLAAKSGYGRSTIRGLFNACYEMGILSTPDRFDELQLVRTSAEDGMLGKIKEVFK